VHRSLEYSYKITILYRRLPTRHFHLQVLLCLCSQPITTILPQKYLPTNFPLLLQLITYHLFIITDAYDRQRKLFLSVSAKKTDQSSDVYISLQIKSRKGSEAYTCRWVGTLGLDNSQLHITWTLTQQ